MHVELLGHVMFMGNVPSSCSLVMFMGHVYGSCAWIMFMGNVYEPVDRETEGPVDGRTDGWTKTDG
jgi:hypothetical protein